MGALWDVEAKDRKGLMKPHLTECTNILISLTWARWKKKITNAARALRKHKTKYEESQKGEPSATFSDDDLTDGHSIGDTEQYYPRGGVKDDYCCDGLPEAAHSVWHDERG